MILTFAALFLIPLLLSLLLTPLAIRMAVRVGAVDRPGGRKIHAKITPRMGGAAVFGSVILSAGLLIILLPEGMSTDGSVSLYPALLLLFSLVSIFLLGLWDDLKPLRPGLKFGVQLLLASLVYLAGFRISDITNPLGAGMLDVEILDFPLTLLWIVGITNAFNLIDGLDGLAAGVASIALLTIATISLLENDPVTAMPALILAGSLIGFLKYNFNPARIFLGDSGSLFIGFSLALLSIQSTTKISTGFALLFPLLVLILPITDTLLSMARRFLVHYLPDRPKGEKRTLREILYGMFTPDRSHIHHQLISLGLTHRNTVLLLYGCSAFFAAGGILYIRMEETETSLALSLLLGTALIGGVRRLRYHEISILNNGLFLPVYERWILNRTTFLGLTDLGSIAVSLWLSDRLVAMAATGGTPIFHNHFIPLLTLQLAILWATGLYREKIRSMGIGNAVRITAMAGWAVLAAGTLLALTGAPTDSVLPFMIHDFYFLLTSILGIRLTWQALGFWFHRNKKSGESVLIYGANENGTMLMHKINHSLVSPYRVVGFLDDNPDLEGKRIYGYPILGGHWRLPRILQQEKVDTILICEEQIRPEDLKRIRSIARDKQIRIKRLQLQMKTLDAVTGDPTEPRTDTPRAASSDPAVIGLQ